MRRTRGKFAPNGRGIAKQDLARLDETRESCSLGVMQLGGIHHLTAVTAHASANHTFYTRTLGMRLVKKTVNQDDVSAYHLFYADGKASPGSDLTFFDWPVPAERRGTNSIVRTGLRVASEASLAWWAKRFAEAKLTQGEIVQRDGRGTLDFEDFEGQRFSLVVDSKPRVLREEQKKSLRILARGDTHEHTKALIDPVEATLPIDTMVAGAVAGAAVEDLSYPVVK